MNAMSARNVSRRAILRGAGGIGLCLPWLEALAPSKVEAAAASPIRRYMWMYFPNGSGSFWLPPAPGVGAAWTLSGILEPLLPSKANVLVLDNVGNYSAYGNAHAEPSHGTNCGPAFHGYESRMAKGLTDAAPGGGISVDQVIATQIGGSTPLQSLQVGLSTIDSNCDRSPCAHSRGMSWSGPNNPLYTTVNPQAVFRRLATAG